MHRLIFQTRVSQLQNNLGMLKLVSFVLGKRGKFHSIFPSVITFPITKDFFTQRSPVPKLVSKSTSCFTKNSTQIQEACSDPDILNEILVKKVNSKTHLRIFVKKNKNHRFLTGSQLHICTHIHTKILLEG